VFLAEVSPHGMRPWSFEFGACREGEICLLFRAMNECPALLFGDPVDFGCPDTITGFLMDAVLQAENRAKVLPLDQVLGLPDSHGITDRGDITEPDVVGISFFAWVVLVNSGASEVVKVIGAKGNVGVADPIIFDKEGAVVELESDFDDRRGIDGANWRDLCFGDRDD